MKPKRIKRKSNKCTNRIAALLVALLLAVLVLPTQSQAAAAPVKLAKSKATLSITQKDGKTVYGTTTIKLKKSSGVKVTKTTYKSKNKKVAAVSKTGKVTAKKKGTTDIEINVTYTKNKKKATTAKLVFHVTVKASAAESTKTGGDSGNTADSQSGAPETATNGSGSNESDVEIITNIIKQQKALGANLSEDLDADDSGLTWENGRLVRIYWSYRNLSGEISFAGLDALEVLWLEDNQLSGIDITGDTSLTFLNCLVNQLSSLDVSHNTNLTDLDCGGNQLSSLDVSNCQQLTYLRCDEQVSIIGYSGQVYHDS